MLLVGCVSRAVVVVVCVLLAVSVFVTTAKECTLETVNECLKPFKSESVNTTGSPIVPTKSEEEMRKLCRDYNVFAECLKPIKPNCQEVDQLVFEGIDNYYDYLCDLKFDEYLKYRTCFKQGQLHEEGKYCNATFTLRLSSLRQHGYSTSYIRDRICQYVEDYLDCVENVVTSFCGKEAARWQRGLDVSSLMPLLNRISCPGWPPHDRYGWRLPGKRTKTNVTIILVVVFFMLLLLAVGALLAMKLCQMNKRQQRQTAPDVAAVPPYASYNGHGIHLHSGGLEQPVGATAAGPLPTKAPPYPESLPPAYDSPSYDNPVYNVNPCFPPTAPGGATAASSNVTTSVPIVPSSLDAGNAK